VAAAEHPQPKLRLWVPIVGSLAVVGVVGSIVALPAILRSLPLPSLPQVGNEEPSQTSIKLSEEFAKPSWTYGAPGADPVSQAPEPPVAQVVSQKP